MKTGFTKINMSMHMFLTVYQNNPKINQLQYCWIGNVHFERTMPQIKKYVNDFFDIYIYFLMRICYSDMLQQKMHVNTIPLHSRFLYNKYPSMSWSIGWRAKE